MATNKGRATTLMLVDPFSCHDCES